MVGPHGSNVGDGYIALNSPPVFIQRIQDPSKELLAESQRVKLQLQNLEKKLNDLKLAAQGVTTLSERERLTQELQLIEQGIQEKHKEACLVSLENRFKIKGVPAKKRKIKIFNKSLFLRKFRNIDL